MNRFHRMNRFFKSCLLASAGLVMLAGALSLTAPGRAFAQRAGEDCVRICDTASSPLHVIVQGVSRVTGDVRISNEDAIATTVSGPVQVTTSPREPLSVVPRMRLEDRFQKSVSLGLANGQSEVSTTFAVPAGKLLVIGSASGSALTNTELVGCGPWCANLNVENQHPSVLIKTSTDNSAFQHPLATVLSGVGQDSTNTETFFRAIWNVGGLMQLYADPGTEIEVIFKRPNTVKGKKGPASLDLTLSGHYVDVN